MASTKLAPVYVTRHLISLALGTLDCIAIIMEQAPDALNTVDGGTDVRFLVTMIVRLYEGTPITEVQQHHIGEMATKYAEMMP